MRFNAIALAMPALSLAPVLAAPTASWDELYKRGARLVHEARYEEAFQAAQDLVATADKTYGPDSVKAAASWAILAAVDEARLKYVDAISPAERALAIFERREGKDSPDAATASKILGAAYMMAGKTAQAEPLLKRALAISEKVFGKNSPETAKHLGNLGGLYLAENKPADAEPLLKKAVAIWGSRPDPVYGVTSMMNLARLYADQGQSKDAERLCRKGLAVRTAFYGKSHPETKDAAKACAYVLRKSGRAPEARTLLDQYGDQ